MEKHEGGWVFISHSHQDIEKVRIIRNRLEEKGFEPLLFFLKCLNDDDEIEDLIKREISEREWFIYVDSPQARESKWVKSERDFIKGLSGKKIFSIDIDGNLEEQIDYITSQLTVFLSYSHKDEGIMEIVRKKLIKEEFHVVDSSILKPGMEVTTVLRLALDKCIADGFILFLITKNTNNAAWMASELRYVLSNKGKIVPVYVGDAYLDTADMLANMGGIQGVHIDENPSEQQFEKLVESIKHRIKYYQPDFTFQHGFQNAVSIDYPYVGMIEDYTFWDCYRLEKVKIPSSVRWIGEKAFRENQDVLVTCAPNSYVEEYCRRKGIRHQLISD